MLTLEQDEDASSQPAWILTSTDATDPAIAVLCRAGHTNIAEGLRWVSYDFNHPLTLLGLT